MSITKSKKASGQILFSELVEELNGIHPVSQIIGCHYETVKKRIKNNDPRPDEIKKIIEFIDTEKDRFGNLKSQVEVTIFNESSDSRFSKNKGGK